MKDRLVRLGEAVRRVLLVRRLRADRRAAGHQIRVQARLLDAVEQAVIATDLDGTITYWNRFAERLYGWMAAEAHGRNILELEVASSPVPAERDPVGLCRLVAGGSWSGELLLRRRDGQTFPALVSNSPIHDDHGATIGVVGVSVDISARRRAEDAHARLAAIVASSEDAIIGETLTGTIESWNAGATRLYGYSAEEAIGRHISMLAPADRRHEIQGLLDQIQQGTGIVSFETVRVRKDGARIDVSLTFSLTRDARGQVIGAASVVRDVTGRVRAREETERARAEAEQARANLRATIAASPLPIITFDQAGLIRSWNAAAVRMFGWCEEEVIGKPSPMGTPEQEDELRAFRARFLGGEMLQAVEVRRTKKDGSWLDLQLAGGPLQDGQGQVIGSLAVFADITARKRMEEALRHQATHDPLTGLPNRAKFLSVLQEALAAEPHAAATPAVLLLDLDRFKEVNNTLGHAHGDLLLQQIAMRLTSQVPGDGLAACLGGDEFAILVPRTEGTRVSATTHALQRALADPFLIAGLTLDVEASIGIALSPEHGTDAHTLLRRADVAMHVAKRARSGFVVFAPKHDTHSPERLSLLGDLRRGIEQGQLFLAFQPQLRIAEHRVCGAEALVRWQHPQRGLIPPDQFIGLAEDTGLIRPLTLWVLEEALRQCGVWRRAGLQLPVAVNLSARSLQDSMLVSAVSDLLVGYQVPPDWLTLEITESAIMDDPTTALVMLTRFNNMGIHLEIDDFGTGYSSLGYLKRLPVDGLKVDRNFVRNLVEDANDAAIVASTVGLAHSLGLHVVAEGVETRQVVERLATLGCDVVQGYYLSRPLPAPELEQWYATWRRQHPWTTTLTAVS